MKDSPSVALVTGASSGIGWELARQLALQGWKVALVARRKERLEELAQQIATAGGQTLVVPADVGQREQAEQAYRKVREQLGIPDLVIANAGVGRPTLVEPFVNLDDVEEMIRTNLLGVIYTLSAAIPDMLARRRGHLVAISSLAGYRGLPGESAYCASKAAVNVYLDGLRIHLRGTGVRVTTVCPGFIKTPMTENNTFYMPGLLDAPEAARRILRAIQRGKKVYNFPWHVHLMVKLSRWVPDSLMQRFLSKYNEDARLSAMKTESLSDTK
ncbi:MAG: short-chain dehydrogenase [Gemmataceae bacterium]|nr:MAG: short-chain dehydrogenase [Gemmataceae bacterium]